MEAKRVYQTVVKTVVKIVSSPKIFKRSPQVVGFRPQLVLFSRLLSPPSVRHSKKRGFSRIHVNFLGAP